MSVLSLDSVVVASEDAVSQELSGEALVLSLTRAEYFGLNDTGTFVWNLLRAPISVRDICTQLVEAFEVVPAEAERDVLELLARLEAERLLTITS